MAPPCRKNNVASVCTFDVNLFYVGAASQVTFNSWLLLSLRIHAILVPIVIFHKWFSEMKTRAVVGVTRAL